MNKAVIPVIIILAVAITAGAIAFMSSNEDFVENSETQTPDVIIEETVAPVGGNLSIILRETVGLSDSP